MINCTTSQQVVFRFILHCCRCFSRSPSSEDYPGRESSSPASLHQFELKVLESFPPSERALHVRAHTEEGEVIGIGADRLMWAVQRMQECFTVYV